MNGFVLVVVVVIGIALWVGYMKAQALAKAKAAYHGALEALTKDPANAALKQQTLALGRAYANLTRDKKGVAMFDEIAMGNDINAACAAAMHAAPPAAAKPARPSQGDLEDRLATLRNLQAKGMISDAEFHERRNAILGSI